MAKEPPPDTGFGPLLGISMDERLEGGSLCSLEVGPQHLNPHGVLHGSVMFALTDQGMGAAVYSLLEPDQLCATIESKIVFIAAVRGGRVECRSRVISQGKRVAILESDVTSEGRLVARALGSYAMFTPSA